jgi:hypothetical protein
VHIILSTGERQLFKLVIVICKGHAIPMQYECKILSHDRVTIDGV